MSLYCRLVVAGMFLFPSLLVAQAVTVTPDGATATAVQNTTGHTVTFTVTLDPSLFGNVGLLCTRSGSVSSCTVPSSIEFFPGENEREVNVTFNAGAVGTGTVRLRATQSAGQYDEGSYTVTVTNPVTYGVSVTPDGVTAPTRTPNTGGYSAIFTVKNTGSGTNTYSISCAGSTNVTCTGKSASSVTLNAGASTMVTASYSVGAVGTGTLSLTASGTNASNGGSYSVPVVSIAQAFQSTVAGGHFSKDTRYLLQETADSFDTYGRIKQLTDARSKVTTYTYGGNTKNAFLTKVTRRKDTGGAVDLVTDLAYDTDGNLYSIKDEGGTFRYFVYDTFGRLKQIKNHASVVTTQFDYRYSRTSGNSWSFQSSSPNLVTTTVYLQQTPSVKSVATQEYIDGLGRQIQSNLQDGTNYYVIAQQYDIMGQPWRRWKPYPRTSSAYDPNFSSNATSWYNTYHATSSAKPYVETQYTTDALSRVKKEIPEYIGTSASAFVQYAYGTDATAKQTYTEIMDEMGKKSRQYADLFGNNVKSILGYGATDASTTVLAYDVLGQRTGSTDPRSLTTSYTRDTRGLLTATTSPDAGTVRNKYDKAGNLRYTQDANEAAAGQVDFTTYDFVDRPLVSGVGTATFSSLNPDSATAPALETTQTNWRSVWKYDVKPINVYPWSLFWTQISPLTLSNVTGRLAAVASASNGVWQVTLYSYDTDGRVATRYVYTQSNGGTVLASLNTTVTYAHDLQDAVTQRTVTVGTSTFNHWYDFDGRGLLWKVYASTSPTKPSTPDVTYTYRPGGALQGRQFAGGPLVPMRYTIREELERIGDPSMTSYPFSARYAYFANGPVSEAEFYGAGSPASAKRYKYTFGAASYDALNRLKSADFSSWGGSAWTSTLAHDLAGITYDRSGNLTALQRYRESGTLIDNLTYTYPSTSNRLSSVTDAISGNAETWDARSGSFTYDANGNLKTAPAPYSLSSVSYDHRNRPLSLTRSGVSTSYRYDHAGQRITKQVSAGNTEVYLLDGATTLGVFTVNGSGGLVASYFNVLARDRVVGRQPSTGNRRYYHTDLLGSTRAVVEGTTVVESYDNDPWGLLLPGRTLGSGTKEGFTGKERDSESGLHYFGARLYMSALGRWASVDPLAEKHLEWSPYNYVLNNPLVLFDPDGQQVAATPTPRWMIRGPVRPGMFAGAAARGAMPLVQGAAAFVPGASEVQDATTVVTGKDPLTGEDASRVAAAIGLVPLPFVSGATVRAGTEVVEEVALRSLTRRNFRANLGRLSKKIVKEADAHHVFPHAFLDDFKKIGIDVNNPRFGAWWKSGPHNKAVAEYNAAWRRWFADHANLAPDEAKEEALKFARELAEQYGFEIHF